MTTFLQFLETKGITAEADGDLIYSNGSSITQNDLSTNLTAWLKSADVFGSTDFYNYVKTTLGLSDGDALLTMLQNGTYRVELNQNSDGAPYIAELGGLIAFDSLFAGAEDTAVKTGKTTQERWYVTEYVEQAQANQPPVADPIYACATETQSQYGSAVTDLTIVNTDPDGLTVDLLDPNKVSDPDSDPLSVTGIQFYDKDGVPIETPSYVTFSQANGTFTIDQNHSDLNDLLKDQLLELSARYTISDGVNPDVENTVYIQITGTSDKYGGHDQETYAKTGQSGGQTFAGSLAIPELTDPSNFDFSAILTMSALGDFDRTNESVSVDDAVGSDDIAVLVPLQGSASGSDPNQGDTITSVGPVEVALTVTALNDGSVSYSGTFSGQVAVGSTATLELDYAYWA